MTVQPAIDFKISLNTLTADSSLYEGWRLQLRGILLALYGLEPKKAREYWDTLNKRTPEELAEIVVEGLREERFIILTHPEVLDYMRRKTGDYDRWIKGMNRLQQRILATLGQ